METCIDVLEQIARSISGDLAQIERQPEMQAAAERRDFRTARDVILPGFATMLGSSGAMPGVLAHGIHWL